MAQTSKATVAGILDVFAGISAFTGSIIFLLLALIGSGVVAAVAKGEAQSLAFLPMVLLLPLAVLHLVAGVVAVAGGIAAFNHSRWGLALAGSIAAVFGFFPVGIAAVIFTILAEPEFRAKE
jgi:hypothetical protein